MNRPKGGRGHKVAYESRVIRVPEPLLTQIDGMIERFYETGKVEPVANGDAVSGLPIDKLQAVTIAKQLLNRKKSARVTVIKLLQVIYDDDNLSQAMESAPCFVQ